MSRPAALRRLEALLETHGFDRVQHEQIQTDLRSGRIGLAQNRLPVSSRIEDAAPDDLDARHRALGMQALAEGRVAVVTLAGGVGSRWTKGAGVVKALNPFCKLGGRHRNFIEVHLAKSLRVGRECGTLLPHIVTTSYLTHDAIAQHLAREGNYHYPGPLLLSPGRIIGLRMVPMERDLRFAWEEMPQQMLDEQAQKVREGLHAALIKWAAQAGEGSNYTDNLPMQCLHPVGHWYEVPNLLRNGTLLRLLAERPRLNYLLVHNIDTAAVDVDAALLGQHIASGAGLTTEVIARHLEDRGGGLARVDGRVRLVEGLALPDDELESRLSYYNSATYWVDIDRLLDVFGLTRETLADSARVNDAVRAVAARMPTYITLKDVKKRWGKGPGGRLPGGAIREAMGRYDRAPGTALPLHRGAAPARPAIERARATRRLAARRLGRVYRFPLRVGLIAHAQLGFAPIPPGLPGSSTDRFTRAAPNHPGKPSGCLPVASPPVSGFILVGGLATSVFLSRPNRVHLHCGSRVCPYQGFARRITPSHACWATCPNRQFTW